MMRLNVLVDNNLSVIFLLKVVMDLILYCCKFLWIMLLILILLFMISIFILQWVIVFWVGGVCFWGGSCLFDWIVWWYCGF